MFKTMMKKTMAALAAMTAMTACTSENDFTEPVSDVKTYQVNIHASFGGTTRANNPTPAPPLEWEGSTATTRAVSFDGTASSSTFRDGERVYVYNATSGKVMLNDGGTAAGYLTPTNISADGKSCDLTGTLTGSAITATDQLLLMYNLNDVYPGNVSDNLRQYSKYNYTGQDGTAAGVRDGATATMTGWSIDGGVLTTAGTAQFVNVQSMFRFSFKDAATDAALSVKRVYITSQNNALVSSYYPMVDGASRYSKYGVGHTFDQALSGYVYMALCIDEASSAADVLTIEVTDGDGNKYEGTKAAPATGFRNGKYYYSSAPIALTLKERRTLPTITWTTPSTAPETIGDEMIVIEDDNADFALSGTSEGVCFVLVQNGTVRLNGLNASYGGDMAPFISGNSDITLDISGANTVACKNLVNSILACDNLKLQGYGTLTVTANDATQCGIRGVANYAPATNANATTTELDVSAQLAATGYKVIRSARTDNADGTYTWTYTVYPAALNLATVAADVTIYDGMTLSGTMTGHQLLIADGATVTLSGASVTGPEGHDYGAIRCLGDATIILTDGTTNTALSGKGNYYAAVSVPDGKTLTINGGSAGTGKLVANAFVSDEAQPRAGIGGHLGNWEHGGNLIIAGGDVEAIGNDEGAGIGAAADSRFGTISISGGEVTATGGNNGAGIGTGGGGSNTSTCAGISISGGDVMATGGNNGAGIGSGYSGNNSCNDITISGGEVTATGGDGAAGIGSGSSGKCGNILISGGANYIYVHKYGNGRCIGKGKSGKCGTVIIDGQTITDDMYDDEYDVEDFPTFPNFNLTLDVYCDYKTSQTWTLTHK